MGKVFLAFGNPIVAMGFMLLLAIVLASWVGMQTGLFLERRRNASGALERAGDDDVHGAIVPAVLGLLALLLGFTFSLAVERYETRRALVLEEANAIGTAYLQSQTLAEPHRARMSDLLTRYTDNRIALAGRVTPAERRTELVRNDALLNDIWAATLAGFDSIAQYDMSSTFVSSVNTVIDLDTSRKAGRVAHVPDEVLWALVIYILIAAAILGYVTRTRRSFGLACAMHVLVVLSLMLIIDIDRPTLGGIRESQYPMELLRQSLHSQSPASFDKWRVR
jgi:membrane protease YdiL (CAAX protease family)